MTAPVHSVGANTVPHVGGHYLSGSTGFDVEARTARAASDSLSESGEAAARTAKRASQGAKAGCLAGAGWAFVASSPVWVAGVACLIASAVKDGETAENLQIAGAVLTPVGCCFTICVTACYSAACSAIGGTAGGMAGKLEDEARN